MRAEARPGLQPVYHSSSGLGLGPRGLALLLPLAIGDAQAWRRVWFSVLCEKHLTRAGTDRRRRIAVQKESSRGYREMQVRIRRRPLGRWLWADSRLRSGGVSDALRAPIPRQEFVNALGGMIRQAAEYIGEPSLRIDVVELGAGDEGVDGRGASAALIGACEGPDSS